MLGEKEYSIGLWVGGDTTPNNFEQAKKQFNEIIKNKKEKVYSYKLSVVWRRN